MSNSDTYEEETGFATQFLDQADDLCRRTDNGDAWAKFMYGDWFVCPTARLQGIIEISICRRKDYVPYGTDESNRLDVVADSYLLGDASVQYGFELPHVSLRDLVFKSIEHFRDFSCQEVVVRYVDREGALAVLNDIERDVMSAISELRSKLC